MNNDRFLAANQSASVFSATDLVMTNRSTLTTDLPITASSYAIAAGGLFTDNGGGNFAGDLNNPFDDARIAANGGLTINQWPTVSGSGSPIAVGPAAIVSDAVRQRWKVENLAQPMTIDVPTYVEPTIGSYDRTFDVGQLPLNGAADVGRAFGDGGLPSVVHFMGGSLALPSEAVLRNLTIVVEQGDLNFNGDRHLLENVTLIVKDGRVNLGDVRAVNTSVFALDGIDLNQGARFSGKNLLVTQHGDVVFDGATATIDPKDYVKVLAHDGNIFLNAAADVRGEFWSAGDFFANQASTIVGSIRSQHDITFNAQVRVISDISRNFDFPVKNQPAIAIIDSGSAQNNWDTETGAGILDVMAAVDLAQPTQATIYDSPATILPEAWASAGTVLPLARPANSSTDFTGRIAATAGAKVRKTPFALSDDSNVVGFRSFNEPVRFTSWIYGDRIPALGLVDTPDERWYYDAEKGGWIASAIVYGDAPGSTRLPPINVGIDDTTVTKPVVGTNVSSPAELSSKLKAPIKFVLKDQSLWGLGQSKSLNLGFSDKLRTASIPVGIGAIQGGLDYQFEASGSLGTFNAEIPALFEVSWDSAKSGANFAVVNFKSTLESNVNLNTAFGISFGANVKAFGKYESGAPWNFSTSLELAGGLNSSDLINSTISQLSKLDIPQLSLDLDLKAKTDKFWNNTTILKAEDTASELISIVDVLSLFPATSLAAKAIKNAGFSSQLGANVKQETFLDIRGFEIDFDGQRNGNELILAPNGSGALQIPISPNYLAGQEFKITPTVQPIVDVWTQFSIGGKAQISYKLATFGESLLGQIPDGLGWLKDPIKKSLPKIDLKGSLDTPFSPPLEFQHFNPFKVSNLYEQVPEIRIKIV